MDVFEQDQAGAALMDPDLTASLGCLDESALEVIMPPASRLPAGDAADASGDGSAHARIAQDASKQLTLVKPFLNLYRDRFCARCRCNSGALSCLALVPRQAPRTLPAPFQGLADYGCLRACKLCSLITNYRLLSTFEVHSRLAWAGFLLTCVQFLRSIQDMQVSW